MKKEWQSYWSNTIRSSRYGLIAIGLSFLFFLASALGQNADQIKRSFVDSMTISLGITALIILMFAITNAFVVHRRIKTGTTYKLSPKMQFAVGMTGMVIGLVGGMEIRAYFREEAVNYSGLLVAILSSAFVSLSFILLRVYKESKEKYQELQTETIKSQYSVLKNQMQPHFLFNSLNSLSELIEMDKGTAAKMTQKLSDLYREILENSKLTTADLKTEVSIAEKYLELEKLRFGKRLSYEIQVPQNSAKIFVPSLVVQTLVENAVKHGISRSVSGGTIKIKTTEENGEFKLTVENTGEPYVSHESNGTGLANTKARLNLLYGSKSDFKILSHSGQTQVSFFFTGAYIV